MVKSIKSRHGVLILVSEYGAKIKTAGITIKNGITGKVTDLQTGKVIAELNNQNRKFTIQLNKQRAQFFSITKE